MRVLSEIVYEIELDWRNINYAAKESLLAMKNNDSSAIVYFLSNANDWKGEVSTRIKRELRMRL